MSAREVVELRQEANRPGDATNAPGHDTGEVTPMPDKSTASDTATYTFRVEGVEYQRTFLPTALHPFDETYEIDGEHPAEALEKLLHEIEWGILDSEHGFTITYVPAEDAGDAEFAVKAIAPEEVDDGSE